MEEKEVVAFQKVGHGYRVPAMSVRSAEGSWAGPCVMQKMITVSIFFFKLLEISTDFW